MTKSLKKYKTDLFFFKLNSVKSRMLGLGIRWTRRYWPEGWICFIFDTALFKMWLFPHPGWASWIFQSPSQCAGLTPQCFGVGEIFCLKNTSYLLFLLLSVPSISRACSALGTAMWGLSKALNKSVIAWMITLCVINAVSLFVLNWGSLCVP